VVAVSLYEPGQGKAGTRDVGAGDDPIEPAGPDLLQWKPALKARDEGTDGERSIHARVIFLPRVLGVRFTWRVCASSRSIA